MNVNYREVKRKAAVGERIKIVSTCDSRYGNGEEFVAERIDGAGVMVKHPRGHIDGCMGVFDSEYIVLEPVTSALSATLQSDPLYAAFRQLLVDNAAAIRAILPELESGITAPGFTVDSAGSVKSTGVSVIKPLSRADVIAKATADIAELLRIGKTLSARLSNETPFSSSFFTAEFHVNREKRTVTALVSTTGWGGNVVRRNAAKFTAMCSPADVFHAEIGKAIALRKALGLAVPSEYTDAPQPEQAEIGALVEKTAFSFKGETGSVVSHISSGARFASVSGRSGNGSGTVWAAFDSLRILDDTDVDYGGLIAAGGAGNHALRPKGVA